MVTRKQTTPTNVKISMSDIMDLINNQFINSDKNLKLQLANISDQLTNVTKDVSSVKDELKDVTNKLIILDKAEALHFLTCPNTAKGDAIESIIRDFPLVKSTTDELLIVRKYIKPISIGYGVLALLSLLSVFLIFTSVKKELPVIENNSNEIKEIKEYIEKLKDKEIHEMNYNSK